MEVKQKRRRKRTTYLAWQLCALESAFRQQQYIVGEERIALAFSLGLNELQVKIWFQNRRIKWRRQQHFSNNFYNNISQHSINNNSNNQ